MDILLVEPAYKNKYPPLGLMKISTYHKSKGDYVVFHKGMIEGNRKWNRIYITTLFTFDYNITVKTINYYKAFVESINDIYIGGISASLMVDRYITDTGIQNICIGTIEDSEIIGFNDHINIDSLPLDYTLLFDTDYDYKSGDNFLGYTTRGCINKCKFCAVPILEKEFITTNNIIAQIEDAREIYGDKRNLLLLDNNILGLPYDSLKKIVDDIKSLGFTHEPTFIKPLKFNTDIKKIKQMEQQGKYLPGEIIDIWDDINALLEKKISRSDKDELELILGSIQTDFNDIFEGILHYQNELEKIYNKHTRRPILSRYVDFNQGLDAREMVKYPEKVELLAQLPIRPFRVAFDHMNISSTYISAIRIASALGVTHFSNYLLYNYNDTPIELFKRLRINIDLAKELDANIYSFPMKFAPIEHTDRRFIGKNWNRQYLSSIRAILNVTKGVVARGDDFFIKAFGENEAEFIKILSMPKDFIVYRSHFEENGQAAAWETIYNKLSLNQLCEVFDVYWSKAKDPSLLSGLQKELLTFYSSHYYPQKKSKSAK